MNSIRTAPVARNMAAILPNTIPVMSELQRVRRSNTIGSKAYSFCVCVCVCNKVFNDGHMTINHIL